MRASDPIGSVEARTVGITAPGVDGVVADKAQTYCPRLERLVPKVLKNRKCLDTYELLNMSWLTHTTMAIVIQGRVILTDTLAYSWRELMVLDGLVCPACCVRRCARYFLSGTRVNVPRPSLFRFSTVMVVALPSAPIVNVTPVKPTSFSPVVS